MTDGNLKGEEAEPDSEWDLGFSEGYASAIRTGADEMREQAEKPLNLKSQTCPQCGRRFELSWTDYDERPMTVIIRGCPSGGVYDVSIECPHCNYEEGL